MKPAPELQAFLIDHGLAKPHTPVRWSVLNGGVSSDIWRADLPERSVCIKRALPKLKVQADWFAPIERNASEAQWLRFANQVMPSAVPEVLAHDATAGLFAMRFLPPERYPVWKSQLMQEQVDLRTAQAVAKLIVAVHNASAGRAALAAQFDTRTQFFALRIEPYLLATAQAHQDLAAPLHALASSTGLAQIALVHGDVSPKNILVGPDGPVLLDAECAWYGEPAFDLAFCLNHLLLKCLVHPHLTSAYMDAYGVLSATYLQAMRWEDARTLEVRAAALLPALLLARVDGKSPVEYLSYERQRELVRQVARPLIAAAPPSLSQLAQRWHSACAALMPS